MATEKTVNYTPEMTQDILARYALGESVETIAEVTGRSVRSIVAKLSREGVYVSKRSAKLAGAVARVTKAELVQKIELAIGAEAGVLASLEKASSEALQILAAAVAQDAFAE